MQGTLLVKPAELGLFKPIRRSPLVLGRRVISTLALSAGQYDKLSRHSGTNSVLFLF